MKNVFIRPAQRPDCPAMFALIRELAEYEKAPEEVTVSLSHFEESGFGKQVVWWAFVAEAEEKIVGMALYYVRYSTWKGQRMYLEDIVVSEAYRRQGIGGLLMQALREEALLKGFSGMHWQVLDWNEPAIRFYEKYGVHFDPAWINVSLPL